MLMEPLLMELIGILRVESTTNPSNQERRHTVGELQAE